MHDFLPLPTAPESEALGGTYAVRLREVSKVYRLYNGPTDQALDALGLSRLMFWRRNQHREFPALDGVTLDIKHGERVGIIGRNGAGKTTLLKLITGNFTASKGSVQVDGAVQALMLTGLGFHPEFSGYDNIRSSLLYNGLYGEEFEEGLADVIDFVELEAFLYQPVKTYSAGMQARLQFACATAVKPDILIIDEVLGAGDAYFSAKSAHRIQKLARSGCTLLLVSHSVQQVLEFCERAIWMEAGKVVLEDDALAVVKAYQGYIKRLETAHETRGPSAKSVLDNAELRNKLIAQALGIGHELAVAPVRASTTENHVSAGGISRWPGEMGLNLSNVRILNDAEEETVFFSTGEPATLEIEIEAEMDGDFSCWYVFFLFSADGRVLTRHCSDEDKFSLKTGEKRRARLKYPSILLGNGEYVFSAAVYKHLDLADLSTIVAYDVFARSFSFRVTDRYPTEATLFHHPCEWTMSVV